MFYFKEIVLKWVNSPATRLVSSWIYAQTTVILTEICAIQLACILSVSRILKIDKCSTFTLTLIIF